MSGAEIVATILWSLVVGAVIGTLARLLVPGRQSLSVFGTILIGAVAAVGGGFLARLFGLGHTDGSFDWITLLIQIGLAVVFVILFNNPYASRR